jgi:hypothetical protein
MAITVGCVEYTRIQQDLRFCELQGHLGIIGAVGNIQHCRDPLVSQDVEGIPALRRRAEVVEPRLATQERFLIDRPRNLLARIRFEAVVVLPVALREGATWGPGRHVYREDVERRARVSGAHDGQGVPAFGRHASMLTSRVVVNGIVRGGAGSNDKVMPCGIKPQTPQPISVARAGGIRSDTLRRRGTCSGGAACREAS